MDEPRKPRRPGGQVLHLRPDTRIAAAGPVDGPSSSELFGILWGVLADMLGTAAAAALVRRAAQRAVPRAPELVDLTVMRDAFEHRYTLPPAWKDATLETTPALSALVRELWLLLVDLTGSVVVNRIGQIPELRAKGIVPILPEANS